MEHLADILQLEEGLLELVLFKLVETRLLLGADEVRFLPRAAREVERARQRTREADLARAAVVNELGSAIDERLPTLRGLAAATDEPWSGIFRDHHDSMCDLVAEIELVAHQNARQARDGLQRLEGGPATIGGHPGDSAPTGCGPPNLSRMADQAGYEAVLGAAARLKMPALLTFLR